MERLTLRDDDGRAIFTPYGLQIYCSTQATADCICKLEEALHAAQEPRLITDADFIGNPNMDSQGFLPAWIEYRRDGEWLEYWDDRDDEWSSVTADNYKGEGYRCWTSKPTDEQREAVKWG